MTKTNVQYRHAAIMAWVLASFTIAAQQAGASNGDAWEEFQNDVRQTCLAAAVGKIAVSNTQVDPYGSESYGFALMVGFEAGTTTERVVACAYDKESQKAEISDFFNH